MEVEATRQTITVNKLINTKKELITIEGDMIVPDVKPDILNTIDTIGNVCIYKKEVLEGKARFDGTINLNVIYLADTDEDTTRGLTYALDFTQIIDVENCKSGMTMKSNLNIKNIECRVLNGRKINTKVLLEVEVSIYSNEEIKILKKIDNIEEIQTLNSSIQINNLVGNGNCRATAKDTIMLNEGEELSEILKTGIKVENSEVKVSYNKVLLKADANVKIMYLTEDKEIKILSKNIPVMGFIDINNVSEENILSCNYEIKNIIIKPNPVEQHSIYVEIEFEMECEAMESLNIELIQDMYCPTRELEFKQKEITTTTGKNKIKEISNIRERILIPEISNRKIYDVEIMPNINSVKILNGRAVYEGELKLNFIFSLDENIRIDTKKYTLPFTFSIDNENLSENKILETKIECNNDEFVIISDGTIECKIDLIFNIEVSNYTNINIMEEINVQDECMSISPSMVIYIVKQGDTLWNIAKKYKTTVKEIVDLNKIENPNNLQIGQKLFIPRYSSVKIGNIA